MSFLKQIVNERKESREKEEFVSRVAEKYNCSKELITETYDKALADTDSKTIAKARVYSQITVTEDQSEEPHITSAKDIIDLILPEYVSALEQIDRDMSSHGDANTTPWEEFTALIRYYGLIPAMKKLRLNPQDLHDELDELAWAKMNQKQRANEVAENYDPRMDRNPEDTWNYDYAIDTGWSATCPNCGSSDVMYDDHPSKRTVQRFDCQNCGTKGPWMR